MKYIYSALILALVLAVNVSFAQVAHSMGARLTFTNAGQTDTAYFGIGDLATKCIDAAYPAETEQPPFPPAGAIFSAFNESACLGNGLKYDLQAGSTTTSTLDTFKLKIQCADDASSEASITWSAAKLGSMATAAKITAPGFNVNMLTDSVFSWSPADDGVSRVTLIVNWMKIPTTDGVVEQNSNLPSTFALSQNYPNPFNPTTAIPFAIEKSAFTEVVVFNILGQKVSTLVAGQMNPGTYTANWNGTDDRGMAVSSGVYYVRMNANFGSGENFTQLRKIVLMK